MTNNLRVLKGAPGFKQFKRGDIAGALAAAHLVGAGGAKKFLAGNDSADAYGTKASDYFALGKNVIEAKEGFHGVVKKEIWFRTGEAGAERVDITPMRDPNTKTTAMNSLQNEVNELVAMLDNDNLTDYQKEQGRLSDTSVAKILHSFISIKGEFPL